MIEVARNVVGLEGANSAEFNPATPHQVVVFMPEGSTTHKGGTMRLGARRTLLETVDCISAKLYQVMPVSAPQSSFLQVWNGAGVSDSLSSRSFVVCVFLRDAHGVRSLHALGPFPMYIRHMSFCVVIWRRSDARFAVRPFIGGLKRLTDLGRED